MAQNYTYKKNTTEKFNIKGVLSDDHKTIVYIDSEKEERTITVDKCFSKFGGLPIELNIAVKTIEDLEDEFEDEEN